MSSLSDAIDDCFDDMKTMVERNELTQEDFEKWMRRRDGVQINEYKEFNELWQLCCITCIGAAGLMGLGIGRITWIFSIFVNAFNGLVCGVVYVCLLNLASEIIKFIFGRVAGEVIFIATAAASIVFFFGTGVFRPSNAQQEFWILCVSLGIGVWALIWRVRDLIDRHQRLRLLWEALPKQTPTAYSNAPSSAN
jgi:hypothetical protein